MTGLSPASRRHQLEYLGFAISIEVTRKEEVLALRADIHEGRDFKGRVALTGPLSDEGALLKKLLDKARHFVDVAIAKEEDADHSAGSFGATRP
ncbi:hypothetical protein [Variovorax guangxiensis]|uniref:hypothetical protein n=1 Tax=Variovorax guangxiensis TaxID=1775474 RepID=UPI0028576D96|nr:hypothetical protein [Variovorax guangxiensis]MDR6855880.1 hypothetical protein [Variovorax guangxiensis]